MIQPLSPQSSDPALPKVPTSAQELLGRARILVVDDSRMLRMGISRSLRQLGVQHIEEAADGMAALERLEREPFDLMLLDMEMPLMDGLDVLARMQNSPQLRGLPVIVISGAECIDGVVACIEMGAEDYLPKPFSQVLLRARLTSSLEKKQLRDLELAQRLQLQAQHDLLQLEQEKQRVCCSIFCPGKLLKGLSQEKSVVPIVMPMSRSCFLILLDLPLFRRA